MTARSRVSASLAALAAITGPVPATAQVSGWGGDRVAVPGADAEWLDMGRIEGEGRLYLDQRSIRRENGIVRYMTRLVLDPPGEDGAVESFHVAEVNCAQRTQRLVGVDILDGGGRALFAAGAPADEPFEPINPGGIGEATLGELCG